MVFVADIFCTKFDGERHFLNYVSTVWSSELFALRVFWVIFSDSRNRWALDHILRPRENYYSI